MPAVVISVENMPRIDDLFTWCLRAHWTQHHEEIWPTENAAMQQMRAQVILERRAAHLAPIDLQSFVHRRHFIGVLVFLCHAHEISLRVHALRRHPCSIASSIRAAYRAAPSYARSPTM